MKMITTIFLLFVTFQSIQTSGFNINEATIDQIRTAFKENKLTSKELVQLYIQEIQRLNSTLRAVIEVNPDAIQQAEVADQERKANAPKSLLRLHGIPILLKDNIATKDNLNTTAGSYALLKSVVPRDAGVVKKLTDSGAIILGKAGLSEWAGFRSSSGPPGGTLELAKQLPGVCVNASMNLTKDVIEMMNPYVASVDPCGSSSGSAISVAANLVTVSLGTETDGSILCPSSANSVVGLKPTLGLTSRAGVIPITPRQDSVGPICRTVADAVYVLDAIVGFDSNDADATREASNYIPTGGYLQHLKSNGLTGKRLGIMRTYPFFGFANDINTLNKFQKHFDVLKRSGATLVENLEINNVNQIINDMLNSEFSMLLVEFKIALNAYLTELVTSPVRSLAEVIAYNNNNTNLEMIDKYPQDWLLDSQKTNGIGNVERELLMKLKKASEDGFEKLMKDNNLDALVTPDSSGSMGLAIGGNPGISVPAVYNDNGTPYGICFGGLKGSEPKLIEIAYGFEQATKYRKPPPSKPAIHLY